MVFPPCSAEGESNRQAGCPRHGGEGVHVLGRAGEGGDRRAGPTVVHRHRPQSHSRIDPQHRLDLAVGTRDPDMIAVGDPALRRVVRMQPGRRLDVATHCLAGIVEGVESPDVAPVGEDQLGGFVRDGH